VGVLIVNGRRSDRTDGEIEVWIILIPLSMLEVHHQSTITLSIISFFTLFLTKSFLNTVQFKFVISFFLNIHYFVNIDFNFYISFLKT
jgi:hypothetical protein